MTSTSIILTTFNGENYIIDQLDSIINQTIQPNEIIICDDNSNDSTLDKIKEWSSRKIHDKKVNLVIIHNDFKSISANISSGIIKAKGDYIFLSDQDDIWKKNKIASCIDAYQQDENIGLLINDQIIVDKWLKIKYPSKIQLITKRVGNIQDNYVSGCATSFKKSIRDILIPIPNGIEYDVWIHALADAINLKAILGEKLQLFRRHGNNSSSWSIYLSWLEFKALSFKNIFKQNQYEIYQSNIYFKNQLHNRLIKIKNIYAYQSYLKQINIAIDRTIAEIKLYKIKKFISARKSPLRKLLLMILFQRKFSKKIDFVEIIKVLFAKKI